MSENDKIIPFQRKQLPPTPPPPPVYQCSERRAELAASESFVMTRMSSPKLSRSEPTGLARFEYHVWGVMLEKHHKLQPKPKTTDE